MGESILQVARLRILLLFSLIVVGSGCEPSYHVTPAHEFSSKYQWAWPVDTIGPYLITVKLVGDSTGVVGQGDSTAALSGMVVSSYYSKKGAPAAPLGLTIDSVKLNFAGDQPDLSFSFVRYQASFRTDDGRFFSGPGAHLDPLQIPDSQMPDIYKVFASLTEPGSDSVVESGSFSHHFQALHKPDGSSTVVQPLYESPFSPMNDITYEVPDSCPVRCVLYNVMGEAVDTLVDETLPPGLYRTVWKTDSLTSGIYFARWTICGVEETKKLMLLR
jgi:hypothetical protein